MDQARYIFLVGGKMRKDKTREYKTSKKKQRRQKGWMIFWKIIAAGASRMRARVTCGREGRETLLIANCVHQPDTPPPTHTHMRKKTSNNKTTINKFPLRGFSPCPVCHADSYFGGNNTKEELVYGRALAMSSFHFASNQSMASCLVMRWEMPTRFLQRRRRATRKPLRASTT